MDKDFNIQKQYDRINKNDANIKEYQRQQELKNMANEEELQELADNFNDNSLDVIIKTLDGEQGQERENSTSLRHLVSTIASMD